MGIVRHVGWILDGKLSSRPFELLPDGDLLFLIEKMLRIRGLGSVRVSKVKGHADETMVRAGTVRGLDKLGNDEADEAADFGRGGFRGGLLTLGGIFLVFAPDGVLLSLSCIASLSLFLGLCPKRRRVAVRNRAFLPGPLDLWVGSWISVAVTPYFLP